MSAEGGTPGYSPGWGAGQIRARESGPDEENVCRGVFSWSTKSESEKPRPAGTSRLQTQIRGRRDGRGGGGGGAASVKPGSHLTASAADGGVSISVSW